MSECDQMPPEDFARVRALSPRLPPAWGGCVYVWRKGLLADGIRERSRCGDVDFDQGAGCACATCSGVRCRCSFPHDC